MRADADSSDTLLSRLSRGYFLLWKCWPGRLPVALFRPSEKGRRAAAVAVGDPAAEERKTTVDVDTNCFRAALRSMGKPKTNDPVTEEEQSENKERERESERYREKRGFNEKPSQNNGSRKERTFAGRKREKKRHHELLKGTEKAD
jgi:hypothetical protein